MINTYALTIGYLQKAEMHLYGYNISFYHIVKKITLYLRFI